MPPSPISCSIDGSHYVTIYSETSAGSLKLSTNMAANIKLILALYMGRCNRKSIENGGKICFAPVHKLT